MWIVAKVKKNNLDLFCSQLKKKLSDIKYYFPKTNTFCKKHFKKVVAIVIVSNAMNLIKFDSKEYK